MGGDDGGRVDHGGAEGLGLVAVAGADPDGGRPKAGSGGGGALGPITGDAARVDGQELPFWKASPCRPRPLEQDAVGVGRSSRLSRYGPAKPENRPSWADFLADAADAAQQSPSWAFVHWGNETVADLQARTSRGATSARQIAPAPPGAAPRRQPAPAPLSFLPPSSSGGPAEGPAAVVRKTRLGMPGMSPRKPTMPAVTAITRQF